MGVFEVAAELKTSKQRIVQLRLTPNFPEPLICLHCGPIWEAADIKRFASTWERKPGRPRKSD